LSFTRLPLFVGYLYNDTNNFFFPNWIKLKLLSLNIYYPFTDFFFIFIYILNLSL